MMAECIRHDMDCAAICRMAAAYMARDSRYAGDLCNPCADVCEACGAECARHAARSVRGIRSRTARLVRRRAAVALRSVAGWRVQPWQNHVAKTGPFDDARTSFKSGVY
jgi:hypothetical protein